LSESQVAYLLKDLCIDLGFCFSADVAKKFESDPPRTVEAFTRAVLNAEGLDPELANRWLYDQVRRVVAAAFDSSAKQ
jgi:hypothetical protein